MRGVKGAPVREQVRMLQKIFVRKPSRPTLNRGFSPRLSPRVSRRISRLTSPSLKREVIGCHGLAPFLSSPYNDSRRCVARFDREYDVQGSSAESIGTIVKSEGTWILDSVFSSLCHAVCGWPQCDHESKRNTTCIESPLRKRTVRASFRKMLIRFSCRAMRFACLLNDNRFFVNLLET